MFKLILVSVVVLTLFSSITECAKILAIFPTASKSHWILGNKLMLELANSGHEVTVISPFPLKKPVNNYRDIGTVEMLYILDKKMAEILNSTEQSAASQMIDVMNGGFLMTNFTLKHPNVQKLLKSNEKFDLIFLEIFFTDAMLGLGTYYNAPIVALSTVGPIKWITDLIGTPLPISYVPNVFLPLTDKMSYGERLLNAVTSIIETVLIEHHSYNKHEALYNEIFPDPKPPLWMMRKKGVSLGLTNSHFSLSFAQPGLPNQIEVGGMHINTKPNPLPEDLQQFINSSKHGVIYFSMGGNLRPSFFPKEKLDAIVNALLKMKQRVLFKWDKPEFFKKNEKILVRDWFPQDDILAHPNVKLFITHGGLLSCTEATYHGMPVIGIPVFGDQQLNMARVQNNGLGVMISYKNVTEEALDWALNEVINNPSYKEKAVEISTRFRDQPLSPLETAKFWVEYVIRHKGAPFIQSSGQDLSFIEYHSIDIWVTLGGILFAIFLVLFVAIKCLLNLVFGSTNGSDFKKKKKDQ